VQKVKTFHDFKQFKAHQWQEKCKGKGKGPAKEKDKNKAQDVAISIGLIESKEANLSLKPVRGKRVLLKVSNMAPYQEVRS